MGSCEHTGLCRLADRSKREDKRGTNIELTWRRRMLWDTRHMPDNRVAGPHGGAIERTTTILVVEDDCAVAELLRAVVNGMPGWGAVVVQDAAGAMDVMRHVPIDLLVMDVNLPGTSGPQLLDQLRSSASWNDPPVIFTSAAGPHPDVDRALRAGVVGSFIAKPFDVDDLVETMRAAARRAPAATHRLLPARGPRAA